MQKILGMINEVAAIEGYYNDAAESLGAQGFFSDVISSSCE
jgi:hypothetical protein